MKVRPSAILLAIPNASVTEAGSLTSVPVDDLLDLHYDQDHGRAVVTYGGSAASIVGACLAFMEWAVSRLGLPGHRGVHPRFGVVDILPVVPYSAAPAVAAQAADEIAGVIEESLELPVYRYGAADPNGRSLPELRRHLRTTPHKAHPTAGVVCIGVRDPLVAFNLNFRGDLQAARLLARNARASDVRALGFPLASRGLVQVSMNLIAPDRVGPKTAFDRVVTLAKDHDLELVDCEVVGLVPHPNLSELEGLPLRAPVRSIEQALEEKGLL